MKGDGFLKIKFNQMLLNKDTFFIDLLKQQYPKFTKDSPILVKEDLIIINKVWVRSIKYSLTEKSLVLEIPELSLGNSYIFRSSIFEFPKSIIDFSGTRREMVFYRYLIFRVAIRQDCYLTVEISEKSIKQRFSTS